MHFFNFTNSESYHFFHWLCRSGKVDLDTLVRSAMEGVDGDLSYQAGADVSSVARDNLISALEQVVLDLRLTCWTQHQLHLDHGIGEPEELAYDGYPALFGPLLCEALGRVSLPAVAKAILIRAGKWAPDRTLVKPSGDGEH